MILSTGLLLYLVFAIGGLAVYFLLPRTQPGRRFVGPIIGVLAVSAWLIVLAVRVLTPSISSALFALFATIAVAATARVITHSKPFYSAIYFVLVVVAVTALLILQQAEFLAIALIIIYAGAILVTYLFLIMLAQQTGAPNYDRRAREPFMAVLAGFVLMAAIAGQVDRLTEVSTAKPVLQKTADSVNTELTSGNTFAVGVQVMSRYVVALQISGVLLLISMVGAVALSRKRTPIDVPASGPVIPLGEVGRKAEPF